MSYAELFCLSNFSFLRAASHPHELVEQAAALGYQALALTDECSVAGVVRAYAAVKGLPAAQPLKLIVGSEFVLMCGTRLVLLVPDQAGYAQLCGLITRARRRCDKGHYRLQRSDLRRLDALLAIWLVGEADADAVATGAWLQACFSQRLWLGLQRHLDGQDKLRMQQHQRLAAQLGVPTVACGGVLMHQPQRRPLLDTLHAIRLGTEVARAGLLLQGNSEAYLRPLDRLQRLFPAEALAATVAVAARCRFDLGQLRYDYPPELVPPGLSASAYLRQLALAGAAERFPAGVPDSVQQQLQHELLLVAELGYEAFFLTIHDIVSFARQQRILYQGRGSAANSVVCYCLRITEVDPTKIDVLFERFISKERGEPPDIDVDFEHQRREEVIQYIYKKYGRERAALAATVICYRFRSAVRDVGKALGIEASMIEQLLANIDRRDHQQSWQQQLEQLGIRSSSVQGRALVSLVEQLIGFPRHLSQHVGGFVIAAGPLHQLVPVENAAMPERTVIQWDKDDLEELGLLKVDILALGMLSAIRRCFDLIRDFTGQPMGMAQVEWEQAEVYAMLQRADSIGVFQIESRAQSNMLPRLKPACYYDLVVQIAIVRPGPIQGDMVHPYLRRRRGEEPVEYPNQALKPVLERTLGVPLFQEQVIKLAMVAAGFSAGEADQLRRAMASWKRHGQLQRFERKFIEGMLANGYPREFAEQVFRQIRGFGEYGFPESHSASFALLAYVSAWLKYHYPVAFCCALLNSQPMGFYTPNQLIQDLQRHGGCVLPVDVQHSDWAHRLERVPGQSQPALRLGLSLVQGLAEQAGRTLLARRPSSGFTDFDQLCAALPLSRDAREALAAAGALRSLSGHRYQSRWQLAGIEAAAGLLPLRSDAGGVQLAAPTETEDLIEDYASLGLSLGRHPLALLKQQGELTQAVSAEQLSQIPHGALVTVAGLVVGRQRPATASGVTFVSLEDETGLVNLVVWRDTARAQRQPFLTAKLLEVRGLLEREGSVVHVIAGKLTDRSMLLAELRSYSRDFH